MCDDNCLNKSKCRKREKAVMRGEKIHSQGKIIKCIQILHLYFKFYIFRLFNSNKEINNQSNIKTFPEIGLFPYARKIQGKDL